MRWIFFRVVIHFLLVRLFMQDIYFIPFRNCLPSRFNHHSMETCPYRPQCKHFFHLFHFPFLEFVIRAVFLGLTLSLILLSWIISCEMPSWYSRPVIRITCATTLNSSLSPPSNALFSNADTVCSAEDNSFTRRSILFVYFIKDSCAPIRICWSLVSFALITASDTTG